MGSGIIGMIRKLCNRATSKEKSAKPARSASIYGKERKEIAPRYLYRRCFPVRLFNFTTSEIRRRYHHLKFWRKRLLHSPNNPLLRVRVLFLQNVAWKDRRNCYQDIYIQVRTTMSLSPQEPGRDRARSTNETFTSSQKNRKKQTPPDIPDLKQRIRSLIPNHAFTGGLSATIRASGMYGWFHISHISWLTKKMS